MKYIEPLGLHTDSACIWKSIIIETLLTFIIPKKIRRKDRGLEKGYRGTARYEKAGHQARRKPRWPPRTCDG